MAQIQFTTAFKTGLVNGSIDMTAGDFKIALLVDGVITEQNGKLIVHGNISGYNPEDFSNVADAKDVVLTYNQTAQSFGVEEAGDAVFIKTDSGDGSPLDFTSVDNLLAGGFVIYDGSGTIVIASKFDNKSVGKIIFDGDRLFEIR